MTSTQLDQTIHNMSYHPPTAEGVTERFERLRAASIEYATLIDELVPDGRDKAMAFTDLEHGLQHAIGGIARHQDRLPPLG